MTSPAPTPAPAPDFDPAAWRHALNQLAAPGMERLLIVQCSLDWLRPPHQALRDTTDAAVLEACTRHPHLQVDRVVLHNLPVLGATATGDLAQLNTALATWMYRLTVTAMLLTHPERQRVHRLIVPGRDTTADLADHLDQQRKGHT